MNNPLSLCVRTCVALLSFLLSLGVGTAAQGVVVSGTAEVVGSDIVHPNGNIYDQVLLTGNLATLRAEPGKVTRCSFIDENGDIVCPCHASIFDPANGAAVLSGPAGRPLPALPVSVEANGTIIAGGTFDGPVGPQ